MLSPLEQAHEADVRPWLDLIDGLRALGCSRDIPLPMIAVVGDQSSGKSSVLESISGIPFPRGSGLVTRCPTQIILKRSPPGTQWTATAAVSWSRPQPSASGTVQRPEQLTDIIEQLTAAITSQPQDGTTETSCFSSYPIVITVNSPSCPDISLTDLPGIVRTHTQGQGASVVQEVNDLIESYIREQHTVILAVVPANQDVATVDILERAARVDPEGQRTIGVLTKPDLIGAGNEEEVLQVLYNVRKPLKLGYVMVKNPSQKELQEGVTRTRAQVAAKELEFFRSHQIFSQVPENLLGSHTLTQMLTKTLVQRIRHTLPHLRWLLEQQLDQTQSLLRGLGTHTAVDTAQRQHTLMQVTAEFSRLMRCSMKGEYRHHVLAQSPVVRLQTLYQKAYKDLSLNMNSTNPAQADTSFAAELEEEMRTHKGRELVGFVHTHVFYAYMARNVETWRPIVNQCRDEVCSYTLRAADLLISSLVKQYPNICKVLRDITTRLVDRTGESVSAALDDIIAKEGEPFTANDTLADIVASVRFKKFDAAVFKVMSDAGDKPSTAVALRHDLLSSLGKWYMSVHGVGSVANAEEMQTLIQAYWSLASRRMVDCVCMTLEHAFAGAVATELEAECFLYATSLTPSAMEVLFTEDAGVTERRGLLIQKRLRLENGLQLIREKAPDCLAQRMHT